MGVSDYIIGGRMKRSNEKKEHFAYKAVLCGLLPCIVLVLALALLINLEMAYGMSAAMGKDGVQESFPYLVFFLINVLVFLVGGALAVWWFLRYFFRVKEVVRRMNVKTGIHYGNLADELMASLEDYEACKIRLEQMESAVESDFIERWLNAEFKSESVLRAEAENVGIDVYGYRYLVLLAGIYNNVAEEDVDAATIYESTRVLGDLKLKLEQESCLSKAWARKLSYRSLAIVIQLQDSFSKESLCKLGEEFRQKYGVNIFWGIGRLYNDPLYLWKCKEEAYVAMSRCDAEHVCIEYSPELDASLKCYFPSVARNNLLAYVRSGNEEETRKIIALLKEENCVRRVLSHNQFIDLNGKIIRMLEKFQGHEDYHTEDMIDSLNEFVIRGESSHEEYFDRLNEYCMELCRKYSEVKKEKKGRLAGKIKEFVDNNYQDSSLSLTKLGVVFNISDSYVSLIFKECYGINFSTYLEEIRIRQSGRLLEDTDLTVREIAEQTGYTSEQSFRRAFKKVRGISPKDARQIS